MDVNLITLLLLGLLLLFLCLHFLTRQSNKPNPGSHAGDRPVTLADLGPREGPSSIISLVQSVRAFFTEPAREVTLRLDAAVPETVAVNHPFTLAVAIRQSTSPLLKEQELSVVRSADMQVEWPQHQPFINLQLQLVAPDCQIHTADTQPIRLYRQKDSPIFYFSLTPQREGAIHLIINVYQQQDWLGSTRIQTQVQETMIGQLAIKVESGTIHPNVAARLRGQLIDHFSLEELKTLAADVGIDYENLPPVKDAMARDLVIYCARQQQIGLLLEKCQAARPQVTWV